MEFHFHQGIPPIIITMDNIIIHLSAPMFSYYIKFNLIRPWVYFSYLHKHYSGCLSNVRKIIYLYRCFEQTEICGNYSLLLLLKVFNKIYLEASWVK